MLRVSIAASAVAGFLAGLLGAGVGGYMMQGAIAQSPSAKRFNVIDAQAVTAHRFYVVDEKAHTVVTVAAGDEGGVIELANSSGKRTLQLRGSPWLGLSRPAADDFKLGVGLVDEQPAIWFSGYPSSTAGSMKVQLEADGPAIRMWNKTGEYDIRNPQR